MGTWFSGRWYTADAIDYIDRVRNEMDNVQSWLSSDF